MHHQKFNFSFKDLISPWIIHACCLSNRQGISSENLYRTKLKRHKMQSRTAVRNLSETELCQITIEKELKEF